MPDTLTHLADAMQTVLDQVPQAQAKPTGFIRRQRKLTAAVFVKASRTPLSITYTDVPGSSLANSALPTGVAFPSSSVAVRPPEAWNAARTAGWLSP